MERLQQLEKDKELLQTETDELLSEKEEFQFQKEELQFEKYKFQCEKEQLQFQKDGLMAENEELRFQKEEFQHKKILFDEANEVPKDEIEAKRSKKRGFWRQLSWKSGSREKEKKVRLEAESSCGRGDGCWIKAGGEIPPSHHGGSDCVVPCCHFKRLRCSRDAVDSFRLRASWLQDGLSSAPAAAVARPQPTGGHPFGQEPRLFSDAQRPPAQTSSSEGCQHPSIESAVERLEVTSHINVSHSESEAHLSAPSARRSVGTGSGSVRYAHNDTSSTQTYPGRIKAPEGSPTARTYPSTPRRQAKHTSCSDNHGIRTPTPEQYLTPLQQKEVCIRHLRARLRENVERLQHRDCEIDELRTQLYRMQEDWIEEECHRVEAQLALKEARREIQHLQEVVESVKTNLGVREQDPHDHKPYSGLQGARPGGRSRSCGCSPASTLSRGTTYTRLSSEALQLERGSNVPEPGGAPCPAGQSHLLLEAALLPEPLAPQGHIRAPLSVPRSSTYERLCSGGAVLPVSHSCHTLSSSCRCSGHAYLPHHHLFLHLPQEEPPVTAASTPAPAAESNPVPVPAAGKKPEVRSQACSPTMTWLCEENATEQLSVISSPTMDVVTPLGPPPPSSSLPPLSPPEFSYSADPLPPDKITKTPAEPRTCQPQPAAPPLARQEAADLELDDDNNQETEGTSDHPTQRCHWSRYFLVDLLALAMPVVPTMAWLCRGTPHDVMPAYHIGSLLRGCCAVALHSLRRQGAGRRRRPASMNGATSI